MKTEFKGTKKWHAVEFSGRFEIMNEPFYDGLNILDMSETPEEEVMANAKLISVAPELLEALKFMVDRFDEDDNKFSQRFAITEAKEVINKALNL